MSQGAGLGSKLRYADGLPRTIFFYLLIVESMEEGTVMLFLTYWELNENMSVEERNKIATGLMESGAFPPEGVDIIRWDATPDGWGIVLAEAETAAAMNRAINLWRMSGAGFFKMTKTAPAQPAREVIEEFAELLEGQEVTQPVGPPPM